MLSFIGSILGGLAAKIIGWLALIRVGQDQQQARDIAANEAVIQKQRDDATGAGPIDPRSDRDKL